MNQSYDPDLDRQWTEQLDRELRALPDRPAPAALMPRVLATLQARARLPWYRRPWLSWPRKAQLLAIAFLVAYALGLVYLTGLAWPNVVSSQVALEATQVLHTLAVLGQGLLVVANSAFVIWRTLFNQPAFLIGLAVLGAMYLLCLGAGAACYRFITHQS